MPHSQLDEAWRGDNMTICIRIAGILRSVARVTERRIVRSVCLFEIGIVLVPKSKVATRRM